MPKTKGFGPTGKVFQIEETESRGLKPAVEPVQNVRTEAEL